MAKKCPVCPKCELQMKPTENGFCRCPKCGAIYIPAECQGIFLPASLIGIH